MDSLFLGPDVEAILLVGATPAFNVFYRKAVWHNIPMVCHALGGVFENMYHRPMVCHALGGVFENMYHRPMVCHALGGVFENMYHRPMVCHALGGVFENMYHRPCLVAVGSLDSLPRGPVCNGELHCSQYTVAC